MSTLLTAVLLLPVVMVPTHHWPQESQEFSPGTQKHSLLSPSSLCSSPQASLVSCKYFRLAPTVGPLHLLCPWSGPILPQISSGVPPFWSLFNCHLLSEALTAPSLKCVPNISLLPFLLYVCSTALATTGQVRYFPYLLGLLKRPAPFFLFHSSLCPQILEQGMG